MWLYSIRSMAEFILAMDVQMKTVQNPILIRGLVAIFLVLIRDNKLTPTDAPGRNELNLMLLHINTFYYRESEQ